MLSMRCAFPHVRLYGEPHVAQVAGQPCATSVSALCVEINAREMATGCFVPSPLLLVSASAICCCALSSGFVVKDLARITVTSQLT